MTYFEKSTIIWTYTLVILWTSGYTLYLIFTNPSSLDINATVNPDLITTSNDNIKFDHYPISFNLPFSNLVACNSSSPKIVQVRNLKGIDLEVFAQSLICELESLEAQPTFFEQLSLYNQSLRSTLNKFAPIHPKLILPKETEQLLSQLETNICFQWQCSPATRHGKVLLIDLIILAIRY